ncbi:Pyoverdine/dityrosine biosynthesis protein-domain-containing protein [Nemania sp. FL0031]|nr:Pyoverdine/dityrosine biosynthesis protein-domain-containing protein [Nemania sp. FL0031]
MSAAVSYAKPVPIHSVNESFHQLSSIEEVKATIGETIRPVNVTNFFQNEEGKRTPEEQRRIAESNAKPPPKPKTVPEMAQAIVHVLGKYRLSHRTHFGEWPAKAIFLRQTESFVSSNQPVHMILPAFPFKSPNKTTKVLGVLPDAGEEMALAHLNGLAIAIQDVYAPGAKVFIVSDGLMYNDILGVSDQEVWRYGRALRQIAQEKGLTNLSFLRLHNLIEDEEGEYPITEEAYLSNVNKVRDEIVQHHLPEGFDLEAAIANEADTTLTYRGYLKFLELDLASQMIEETKAQNKARREKVAKHMILRGRAFASAIAAKYPNYLRLSIHPSTESDKLSISVIPQEGRIQTPWHSALVRAVDGTITMAHAGSVSSDTHELVSDHEGRPLYFQERSELLDWPGMSLSFDYLYPTGIIITAKDPAQSYSLKDVPMQKVRNLSTQCSPVILRGFKDTTNEKVYESKSYELGTPAAWTFGIKTSVKDSRGKNSDPVTSIVTSNEPMPMHYDGFFFLVPKVQPDGTTKMVSSQPRYQYFSAVTPSAQGSGYTLFASSPLMFKNLPAPHTVETLRGMTWDCRHSSNWDEHMNGIDLIAPHPETGEDCLRYHEPWPQWKTKFTYNRISIENGPQWIIDVVDEALYDRRSTLWFEWTQGDVLVSDNYKMLHTRTGFSGTEDRELWRIHVN